VKRAGGRGEPKTISAEAFAGSPRGASHPKRLGAPPAGAENRFRLLGRAALELVVMLVSKPKWACRECALGKR